MTAYVDDARIQATVGRVSGRWSHLFADSQPELHEFAAAIGLKRTWFQPGRPIGGKPSRLWHYDVTDRLRERAIRAGALAVSSRDAVAIMRDRDGLPPIGTPPCDYFGRSVGGVCGASGTRLYLPGWRCAAHTPAALAGQPEPDQLTLFPEPPR